MPQTAIRGSSSQHDYASSRAGSRGGRLTDLVLPLYSQMERRWKLAHQLRGGGLTIPRADLVVHGDLISLAGEAPPLGCNPRTLARTSPEVCGAEGQPSTWGGARSASTSASASCRTAAMASAEVDTKLLDRFMAQSYEGPARLAPEAFGCGVAANSSNPTEGG
jgi:hypothetical protein